MTFARGALGPLGILLVVAATAACRGRAAPPERADIKDAPNRAGARALTLDGARILVDKGGRFDRICPANAPSPPKGGSACRDLHFYAFPVVPVSWSPPDPVPAWVTCSREKSFEACETRIRAHTGEITGPVTVRTGDQAAITRTKSGWEDAIEDAGRRHGLSAASHGPVLVLVN